MSLALFGADGDVVQWVNDLMQAHLDATDQVKAINTDYPGNAAFEAQATQQLVNIAQEITAAGVNMTQAQYASWMQQIRTIHAQAVPLTATSVNAVNPAVTGVPTPSGFKYDKNVGDALVAATNQQIKDSGAKTIPVRVSTADQISQIAESLFGTVDSGAKQLFMIKSMQLAQKGRPIQVPSNSTASGGGFSTNEKLAVGGVAVLGIGLLIFALARGR